MPYLGIGLHIGVALFFAIHAVRTGQNMFWLLILFSFPLFGSVVYFVAIYLPDSRLPRDARKAVVAAAKVLDPTRALRSARADFEYAATAQNRMRLAAALLEAGESAEAATNYEACLQGIFVDDLDIRLGAARACFDSGDPRRALEHLDFIRNTNTGFRSEQVALLFARSLAAIGRAAEAKAAFDTALELYGGFDSKAEYLIWALTENEEAIARRLHDEVARITERWNRRTRELNRPLLQRLDAAQELAKRCR